MTYTIPFTELGKNDLFAAGAKGANLGELTAASLPVPPGFVLTTAAYDTFVKELDLEPQILDLAAKAASGGLQAGEDASAAIKNLFTVGKMPPGIQTELVDAYRALNAGGNGALAVRSSATAEDLPGASFAGQHDTFLNISGEEALIEAVKQCWASLWTFRSIAYRDRQDIDPATVSLAVIVQQLVPADAAGVMFTANPLDGTREQIVINASWGLGVAIVSGQVPPDTIIVEKSDMQVAARETATKTIMTLPVEQGTEEQPVPRVQQNLDAIDDDMALALARLGAQIEALFGMPMDVEWAISRGQISILQARPITNLPPAPLKNVRWDPPRPGTIWMRRQIVEHMPEPLSPLFAELYVQDGLDRSLEAMTIYMSELSGLEIKLWDFLDPPFAATVNGYAYSIASFNFSWKLIPVALRVYIVVLPKMIRYLLPRWREESLPGYLASIERWKKIDATEATDEQLLQGIRELAAEDAIYWFAAAVPLGLARITDAALDRYLKMVSNGDALASGSFLRGFPSKTAEAQVQLEAIAAAVHGSDTLRELVMETPAARLLTALAKHPDGSAALTDLKRYLDVFGHQIYNLDFAAPTLADDPLPVLLSLKTAVAHPERDVRAQQAELAAARERLVTRTNQSLNPLQRWIFTRLLSWAQSHAPYREEALFYVGAAWPALRRLAFELGRRLTQAGSLEGPDDVYFLKSAELSIASAARARGTGRPELARLAQKRRTLREAQKRLEPPVSVPPDGRMKFGPIDMAMFEPKPRTLSKGPALEGFAVSPGKVTAPASVIRSPADFAKMAPDSILVCTTTTPAWTPLFAQAKGLVTDIGGALAHGSIVAREYGIPAVMGTGVATQRIENGERIQVDGDRGVVIQVDKVDPIEYRRLQARRLAARIAAARRRKAILALAAASTLALVWWRKRRR